MARWYARACLIAVVLTAWPQPAAAKGPVDAIVIRGGGLQSPVTITERSALGDFDPWSGRFIDWQRRGPRAASSAPLDSVRSYEVLFYMHWRGRHSALDRDGMALVYDVRYVPGLAGEPGWVYLPGRDDPYRVNRSTIERDGEDGAWHHASAAFSALVQRVTKSSYSDGAR